MKKVIQFIGPVFSLLLLAMTPVQAYHLDGLWRNDRQNITVRIETIEDGFRAKRIDQGIWYRYTAQDEHHYADRYGNYYELQNENEITWNEASTGKRISFLRVDYRDEDAWDDIHHGWNQHPDKHDYQPWMDQWYHDHNGRMDGIWIDSYRRSEIEIISFKGGLRVKRPYSGWVKYYPDRYGDCFRDDIGNTIHIIDHHSIRWTSYHGRHERIYHRR
jgi:hypothetical protein